MSGTQRGGRLISPPRSSSSSSGISISRSSYGRDGVRMMIGSAGGRPGGRGNCPDTAFVTRERPRRAPGQVQMHQHAASKLQYARARPLATLSRIVPRREVLSRNPDVHGYRSHHPVLLPPDGVDEGRCGQCRWEDSAQVTLLAFLRVGDFGYRALDARVQSGAGC